MSRVEIGLLGGFRASVDGAPVADSSWSRRSAGALVKLLALTQNHSLHREQVIDALWPDLPLDDAAPRLHKAAHFARKALGLPNALFVRGDVVALCPDDELEVDLTRFLDDGAAALSLDDQDAAAAVLSTYGGELLPHDLYEPWTENLRRHTDELHRQLLHVCGRWNELVTADPSDEEAHVQLMRQHASAGDRAAALRQFERLEHALHHELGVTPGPEATALRAELLRAGPAVVRNATTGPTTSTFLGRADAVTRLRTLMAEASTGHGRTLFVRGAPGVGKSRFLDHARQDAARTDWRAGSGMAAEIEGAWPYSPVLEAFADLCRCHPTLMDALDDTFREAIESALRGDELHWSGDGGHQRLFVAAAELLRIAAAGSGAVLFIDDVHQADEASLRLLHYLARAAASERAVLVLSFRSLPVNPRLEAVQESLLARGAAAELTLSGLTEDDAAALLATVTGKPVEDSVVAQALRLTGGVPRGLMQIGRSLTSSGKGRGRGLEITAPPLTDLVPEAVEALRAVAVIGTVFATDEFVAVLDGDDSSAFAFLDAALETGALERTDAGFRMRTNTREALLGEVPPHRLQAMHRRAAEALTRLERSPARIGHHLLAAGDAAGAVSHLLAAAETAGALGAYHDALNLLEPIRSVVTGKQRARLLRLRADLLHAVADPRAVAAYREAVETADPADRDLVRARLAHAAILVGDLDTGREAVHGLDQGPAANDVSVLVALGHVAYFSGDLQGAADATREASMRIGDGQNWGVFELVSLQGLVAHDRGEWFTRLRHELRRTKEAPALATAVFDAHLCVAEYLLYGPMPYDEVVALAANLRETAERAGVLRAVAFATTLIGEAALLSGDLPTAERELVEAVELHRDMSASAGEAHTLQRLAELRLMQGDRQEAQGLLRRALPLARWSAIPNHLLQRIHGTLISAANSPSDARAYVEGFEASVGTDDHCTFCEVMFSVPAVIACAQDGDLEAARRHLEAARRSASLWHGTAWEAATVEAEAHLVLAEGNHDAARDLFATAAQVFEGAGQPLDAARARDAALRPVGAGSVPEARRASGLRQSI